MKYQKDSPRIPIQIIDADTEEVIYEINDRTWMTVGECLTDYFVENLFKNELKDKKRPVNLMVLPVANFRLR